MSGKVEPRNFSWFIEHKLAGMGWPSYESINFLADNGIKVLINLTENSSPAYQDAATSHGIKCVHVKVNCYGAPHMGQIQEVVSLVDKESESGVCAGIHCFMGCGRTGTMLACYLMSREDMSADEAIAETKRRRKGSIENMEQEQAVRDYEQYLKRKQS